MWDDNTSRLMAAGDGIADTVAAALEEMMGLLDPGPILAVEPTSGELEERRDGRHLRALVAERGAVALDVTIANGRVANAVATLTPWSEVRPPVVTVAVSRGAGPVVCNLSVSIADRTIVAAREIPERKAPREDVPAAKQRLLRAFASEALARISASKAAGDHPDTAPEPA